MQAAQLKALQVERKWLEEDNIVQRETVHKLTSTIKELEKEREETKAKYHQLKKAYFSLLEKSKWTGKRLDFVIALGREMYNEGQYYKNCYHWMVYFYQEAMWHLFYSQATNSRVESTGNHAVTTVCSWTRAPVVSLEGGLQDILLQPNKETDNTRRPRHAVTQAQPSYSLRLYETINLQTCITQRSRLRLAYPSSALQVQDKLNSSVARTKNVASNYGHYEVRNELNSCGNSLEELPDVSSPELSLIDDDQLPQAASSAKKKKVWNALTFI